MYLTLYIVNVIVFNAISGLTLENYVQPELGNVSVTVWKGEVIVEFVDQNRKNHTLGPEEKLMVNIYFH